MRFVAILLLLLTPALAQTAPPAAQTAPVLRPSVCDHAYYPPEAVRAHSEGTTTLDFKVTAQGGVNDIIVKSSSGHASLDDASIGCVRQRRYTPATLNGVPTEAPMEVAIKWSLNDSQPPPFLHAVVASAQECIRNANPSADALARATDMTVVQVWFYRSESPSVDLKASSGNAELDRLVVQCLSGLSPDIAGDPPVRIGFIVPFSWKTEVQAPGTAGSAPSTPADNARQIAHGCAAAYYPRHAVLNLIEGITLLSLTVSTEGNATSISVAGSSGSTELDDAAVNCARQWRWKAATMNGQTVESQVEDVVTWSLHGRDDSFIDISRNVGDCAKSPAPTQKELEEVTGTTVATMGLSGGAIQSVTVTRSSGSQTLDQRAITCIRNLPVAVLQNADRWQYLPVSVTWRPLVYGAP